MRQKKDALAKRTSFFIRKDKFSNSEAQLFVSKNFNNKNN